MARKIGVVRRAAQQVQEMLTLPEKWAYQRGIRSTEGLTLPHFLCIGAQKAGTSWLYENLRRHPELYLPDQKELHFFDRRFHRPLASYAAKFSAAGSRKAGEVTPSYSDLPLERIRYIRAVMPNVRLILLLRNPIDRAWSHAQMHLLEKGERPRRMEEVPDEEWIAHFRSTDSRAKGDYLRIIQNWTQEFAREQLLTGFFEDIVKAPETLLSEVCSHLGVTTPDDWTDYLLRSVVNKGRKDRLPDHLREELVRLYAEDIASLQATFGRSS